MSDVTDDLATEEKGPYKRPSPSAIKLMRMCEARFGARYIARLPDPQGAKAALGTRCHAIAEEYLRDGKAPNRAETYEIIQHGSPKTYYPGRIVANIVHHLPAAGTVPDVEHKLTLVHRGIEFNGSIDWETNKGIGDHKFTSNVYGDWIKPPAHLEDDPQAVIYGADWFARHDANVVRQQWTYGQFDAKASRPIVIEAERVKLVKALDDSIMPVVDKMLRYVDDQRDWNSLPKNMNACSMFRPNGCPYASKCTRTLNERVRAVMESDFLKKLRAKKAGAAAAVVAESAPAVVNDAPSNDVENDAEEAKQAIVGAINPPGEAADAPIDDPADKAEAAPPKRGRGRPPKQKPQPAPEQPKSAPAQAAPANDDAAEESPSDDARKPLVLLVDCVALRGMSDVTFASDLIAQAHEHVRKSYGALDYRDGSEGIDYGKGAGFLVACVAGLIEDLPADSVVYLDTRSTEGALALQAFMSAATTVIRGAA